MTLFALCSLLVLLVGSALVPTHLWWGEPFAKWYEAEGRQMVVDGRAQLMALWRQLLGRMRQTGTTSARLDRFAMQQSMDVPLVNPFGEDNEVPRRSLRALARQSGHDLSTAIESAAPDPEHVRAPVPVPAAAQAPLSRTFVVVESPEAAQELGRSARRGDIWLNLTRFDVWATVRQRRDALIDELALHPEWTDETLYALGVAIGLWREAGPFAANAPRNRQRTRRLRTAAERRHDGRVAA